jgi:pimeloyl-ACP methyl ester carboxylesterase
MTSELCWFRVLEQLGRQFRIVAPDLRGHGDGTPLGCSRFRLEDCVDDIAALADVLDIKRFAAVGYSIGGMVAQLLWRRHPHLVSGLVLCATARNVQGSWLEKLTSLYLPTTTAAVYLLPFAQAVTAEWVGSSLLGRIQDGESRAWARAQLSRPCRPFSRQSSSPRMSGSQGSTCPPLSLSPRPTSSCRQVDSAGSPAPSRMLLCSS